MRMSGRTKKVTARGREGGVARSRDRQARKGNQARVWSVVRLHGLWKCPCSRTTCCRVARRMGQDQPNVADRELLKQSTPPVGTEGLAKSNVKKLMTGGRLLEKVRWIKPIIVLGDWLMVESIKNSSTKRPVSETKSGPPCNACHSSAA